VRGWGYAYSHSLCFTLYCVTSRPLCRKSVSLYCRLPSVLPAPLQYLGVNPSVWVMMMIWCCSCCVFVCVTYFSSYSRRAGASLTDAIRHPASCAAQQDHRPTWRRCRRRQLAFTNILSLIGFCARTNYHCIAPPTCIAHTVAILVHYYCTIFNPLPTPRFHAIHPTILCIATSYEG